MPINIAARRGAKNQRRKAAVAQMRKMEIQNSGLSGEVRLAQGAPIQHCLVSRELFEVGMGMVVLARGATPYSLIMATFLLDTFALGVKDVFIRSLNGGEFARHVEYMSRTSAMDAADPAYARKLMHDLVAWSRTQGFAPHRDHAKIEPIFGAVDASACDVEFTFGFDGRPLFVSAVPDEEGYLIEADDEAAD
jgi:hypothetical protein